MAYQTSPNEYIDHISGSIVVPKGRAVAPPPMSLSHLTLAQGGLRVYVIHDHVCDWYVAERSFYEFTDVMKA